ncbi:hypothetical protein [Pseudomonas sp. RIT-PI-S]|nr:hypothetical protein [Pseudomonas sp. RIT-PI-S]
MSRIDPVSTVAVAFLLVLIALTSWARAEQPGTTVVPPSAIRQLH